MFDRQCKSVVRIEVENTFKYCTYSHSNRNTILPTKHASVTWHGASGGYILGNAPKLPDGSAHVE